MPAWGGKFNDQEIAAVVSYVRNAWGNKALHHQTRRRSRGAAEIGRRNMGGGPGSGGSLPSPTYPFCPLSHTAMRLTRQARQVPERKRAASDRERTPTISWGLPPGRQRGGGCPRRSYPLWPGPESHPGGRPVTGLLMTSRAGVSWGRLCLKAQDEIGLGDHPHGRGRLLP